MRTHFPTGHTVYILAEGRLVNLGCATGHPSFVMSTASPTRRWPRSTLDERHEIGVYRLDKRLDEKSRACTWTTWAPSSQDESESG